jgi:hypothetical protein
MVLEQKEIPKYNDMQLIPEAWKESENSKSGVTNTIQSQKNSIQGHEINSSFYRI